MPTTISRRLPAGTRRLAALAALASAAVLQGQTFSSGSTGTDGDLIVNTPGVTTFSLTPKGGGTIYNFQTIQIAAGSTLRLSGAVFSSPIYFLAMGPVTVSGTIDISGDNGSTATTATQRTQGMPIPGAGGFGGGAATWGTLPSQPGLGPLGGAASGACDGYYAGSGGFGGNQFLVPLVGGSGGGGFTNGSGGAGGGGLLIASSQSITITGSILGTGGNGAPGSGAGGGAGAGVRLVAPTISGNGTLNMLGGSARCGGASGIIRMEAFQNTFAGATYGTLYTAAPSALFLPAVSAVPSIMVTKIGDVAVPPNPTGSFVVPDVPINSASPLTVSIQAYNIPPGAIPKLVFLTENFPDQTITASPLSGSQTSSTSSATVTLNPGYSVGFVTVTWQQ